MTMSNHQLAGSLSKKTLTIEEKIKLLDANKKPRQSWKQLVSKSLLLQAKLSLKLFLWLLGKGKGYYGYA